MQAPYRGGWQSYDLNFGVFSHIITNFGVLWVVKTSPNLNKPKKTMKKCKGEAVETSKREEVKRNWLISRAGRLLIIS